MKKWLLRILVLAALAVVAVVLRRTVFAPAPVSVRVEPVGRGAVEKTVANSKVGSVKARRRAGLSTGTAGIVTELDVERGDHVKKGALLLRLDDASERSVLTEARKKAELAKASLSRTCLSAERAKREFERNQEMSKEEGLVSVDQLDALRTAWELADADCEVARQQVDVAEAATGVAQAELEKTVLIAPFDAIVADVAVEVGEWVTPSIPLMAAPDLIDAIDPTSLYISAPMDEVDADALAPGLPARVTLDPYPNKTYWGKVVRVAPYVLDVEQQNRTVDIEVELDDQAFAATLLPGTSADVEVVLAVQKDVLRVPTYALLEGERVLVLESGELRSRDVKTGLANWDWTEITSGLEEGDLVVTSLDSPAVKAGAEAVRAEGSAP